MPECHHGMYHSKHVSPPWLPRAFLGRKVRAKVTQGPFAAQRRIFDPLPPYTSLACRSSAPQVELLLCG